MKRYFEVTYPRRLDDLKKELEPIAKKIFDILATGDNKEGMNKMTAEFSAKVRLFTDNTKLHLLGIKIASEKYISHLSPEYMIKHFGEKSEVALIFSILYKKKGEN